ncbi:MAG: hypothetical protein Kow0059_23000 [Candidatus Sumerlaeia bacterium]
MDDFFAPRAVLDVFAVFVDLAAPVVLPVLPVPVVFAAREDFFVPVVLAALPDLEAPVVFEALALVEVFAVLEGPAESGAPAVSDGLLTPV